MGRNKSSLSGCWWDREAVQSLWRAIRQYLKRKRTHPGSALPLLGVCVQRNLPKRAKMHAHEQFAVMLLVMLKNGSNRHSYQ